MNMEQEAKRLEQASKDLLALTEETVRNMNLAAEALEFANMIDRVADILIENHYADDKEAVLNVLREKFR